MWQNKQPKQRVKNEHLWATRSHSKFTNLTITFLYQLCSSNYWYLGFFVCFVFFVCLVFASLTITVKLVNSKKLQCWWTDLTILEVSLASSGLRSRTQFPVSAWRFNVDMESTTVSGPSLVPKIQKMSNLYWFH